MNGSDDDLRQEIALFRYTVIADLVHLPVGARGIGDKLRDKASQSYTTAVAGADHGAATTRSRSLNPLSVAGSRVPTSRTKRSARPSRGERKCLFSRLLINPEKPDLSEKSAPPALKSIWQSRRHIVCETTPAHANLLTGSVGEP